MIRRRLRMLFPPARYRPLPHPAIEDLNPVPRAASPPRVGLPREGRQE